MNFALFSFYQQDAFRTMKWHARINRERSEMKMINNFKKTFGPPDKVVVAFGDFEQQHHMKYKEPVKGKGFRKLFKKCGYHDTYLVNEFRTSCRCYACQGGENEKFLLVQNPRPWKKGEMILRHGLIRCKTCQRTWNRDVNGSLNIHRIAVLAINSQPRPVYLSREKKRENEPEDKRKTCEES